MMKKILIPLLFSTQTFAQSEFERFNGCIGKDSAGRDVKVESLVRNLENCSFAKVYLKENEEKFKENIENQIVKSLKNNLTQDLEDIVIQGEFFNSLNINITNSGGNDQVKKNCQLDKMTEIGNCKGKKSKDYERRKKLIYQAFGASDNSQFTTNIKNKFKLMAGLDEENSCSLVKSNIEQTSLFNASLTVSAMLSLKELVDSNTNIKDNLRSYPLLFLMSKGDPKVFDSFISEIKELKNAGSGYDLAAAMRQKIESFYSKKDNAKSISSTVANSCNDFQKKIDAFVCSDELEYFSNESKNSKRIFEGFDMSEKNATRNRRLNFVDKDMAFMAFGKRCELDQSTQPEKMSLDYFTGINGIYDKGTRDIPDKDFQEDTARKVSELAYCKNEFLSKTNSCKDNNIISSTDLSTAYNCPQSSECNDDIEKTINYLKLCESRQAKILAKKNREKETSLASANDSEASASAKEVELDFFDNLLGDTKKSNFIASDNKKEIKKSEENADDLKLKEFNAQSEPDRIKGVNISSAGNTTNEESEDYRADEKNEPNIVRQANPFNETNSTNKFAAEIAEMRKTQALSNTLTAKRPAKSDSAITKPENYVTKENAELRERIAKLEGMSAAQELSTQSAKTGLSVDQRIQALNKENDYLKNRERELLAKNKKVVREVRENTDFRSAVQQTNRQHEEESLGNMEENGRSIASTQSKGATSNGTNQAKESKDSKETRAGKGLSLSTFGNTGNELKTKDQAEDKKTNAVLLSAEEIEGMDQGKLDQIWKDKKEKLHLGVKNKDKTIDTVIVAMDNSQKPVIENFASLSQDVQRSILDWKLIKDNKLIVRKNELDQMLKKIK